MKGGKNPALAEYVCLLIWSIWSILFFFFFFYTLFVGVVGPEGHLAVRSGIGMGKEKK